MIIPHENDPITAIRSGSYYQVQYFAIIISFIRWSECRSASKTDGVVVADHELCVCPGQIYIIINTHNEPPLILHFFFHFHHTTTIYAVVVYEYVYWSRVPIRSHGHRPPVSKKHAARIRCWTLVTHPKVSFELSTHTPNINFHLN